MADKTKERRTSKPKSEVADAPRVTPADIKDKLDELQETVAAAGARGGAVWLVGLLLGSAAAVSVAYLAGRRSCR